MRTRPRVMVVLPAAESPTTPSMMGRGMVPPSRSVRAGALRLEGGFLGSGTGFKFPSRRAFGVVGLLLLGVAEHRALKEVVGLDGEEVPLRQLAARVEEPGGLAHPGTLDGVADAAPVREAGALEPPFDVVAQGAGGVVAHLVALPGDHQPGYLHELVDVVVREMEIGRAH